jgi:hypothetical protein
MILLSTLARCRYNGQSIFSSSSDGPFLVYATILLSCLMLVWNAMRSRRNRMASFLLFAASVAVLIHAGQLEQEEAEVSPVSWLQFREACPKDAGALHQSKCLDLVGLPVQWSGIVAGMTVTKEPSIVDFVPRAFVEYLRSEDEDYSCQNEPSQIKALVCSASQYLPTGGGTTIFKADYRAVLDVRMRTSMYSEEMITLKAAKGVWEKVKTVSLGDAVGFTAVVGKVAEKVELEVADIVVIR